MALSKHDNQYWPTALVQSSNLVIRGCHGCDRMVVGFTTTCAISAYYHYSCEFEPCSWRGVLDTTLCENVQQQVSGFLLVLRFPPPI